MTDAKFIPGLFFKDKHENAPDFIICKGSIKVADLADFLSNQSGEWINFDLKRSREGKPYASVDDWKPNQGGTSRPARQEAAPQRQSAPADDFADDDLPF